MADYDPEVDPTSDGPEETGGATGGGDDDV